MPGNVEEYTVLLLTPKYFTSHISRARGDTYQKTIGLKNAEPVRPRQPYFRNPHGSL